MTDLNDFYAFKMTTSENSSGGGTGGGSGCSTILIVLAVVGWVCFLISK